LHIIWVEAQKKKKLAIPVSMYLNADFDRRQAMFPVLEKSPTKKLRKFWVSNQASIRKFYLEKV